MKKIIIIGGGPTGIMTATSIVQNSFPYEDFEIILIERNAGLGKKLLISGGGRCNITTGIFDKKILKQKYTRGFEFFESSLQKFGPKKCKKWFENEGLALKIEEDLRVFPQSNNGADVLGIFEKIFQKYSKNIKIFYKEIVEKISYNTDGFTIKTDKNSFYADYLVIATGGNAYAHTGSRGDGYNFARELGHSITKLGPSLSSFIIQEDFLKALSGLSFQNAKICFEKEKILTGSLLFTHFGISGPLTFMLSSHLAWTQINHTKIYLCPIADMNFDAWEHFLMQSFKNFPKRKIKTILKEKLPQKFIDIFIGKFFANIENIFVGEISKKSRQEIAKLLGQGIEITLLDRRPGDEFVTAGGINTDELNAETLESNIVPNLFFGGEILNIDGYTGGFSLQICWSTGYQIGKTISQKLLSGNH